MNQKLPEKSFFIHHQRAETGPALKRFPALQSLSIQP
jgi:hypothetical protein